MPNRPIHPVKIALSEQRDPEKAKFFPRFFKSGPGQYGDGDKFLGVTVPVQRKIAKQFPELSSNDLTTLLHDEYHEVRLTALFILTGRYQKAKSVKEKSHWNEFYLAHLDQVNNWDLVDATAYKILGAEWLRTKQTHSLDDLANSGHLWRERVAVIASFALIKAHQFEPTLQLCERFLGHQHDLIHKATGWMLREVGKADKETLVRFLTEHANKMPRTMLRYAIEKMPKLERERWMGRS